MCITIAKADRFSSLSTDQIQNKCESIMLKFLHRLLIINSIVILSVLSGCSGASNNSQSNIPEYGVNNEPGLTTIDKSSGFSGFLLNKFVENDSSLILVIEAARSKFTTGEVYNITIADSIYISYGFKVYVEKYTRNGAKKLHCSDLDILNAETPIILHCISGKLTAVIESINDSDEIITLKLENATFQRPSNIRDTIHLTISRFDRVLISQTPG